MAMAAIAAGTPLAYVAVSKLPIGLIPALALRPPQDLVLRSTGRHDLALARHAGRHGRCRPAVDLSERSQGSRY